MIEKYVEMKIFVEYTLPLIIFGIIVVIVIILCLVAKIGDAWEKRQQKRIDKYFAKKEEEDASTK